MAIVPMSATFRKLFAPSPIKIAAPAVRFWLGLSITFAVICGGLALYYALRENYIVDSDARQHVFWMQRFSDPGLFPQDLITDYHQSVAPPGYTALYWVMNAIGIPPFLFNKLLPFILGLVATGYCFFVALELLPVPVAGFISSLLLNQALWMRYDLVSGTPRSFIYPLFLAFLYYLLRRKLLPCLAAIALLGLFYPQGVFVAAAVLPLQLLHWQEGRIRWWGNRQTYRFCLAGLITAFLVMLPYALQSSEFGPAISLAEAKVSPEFLPGGRTPFFHNNFWEFWFYGKRSGILPDSEALPPLIWLGVLLPLLPRLRSPLVQQITDRVVLLAQVLLASLGMFLVAHLLLFRLHLPSRYTMHTIPILLALAAGIVFTVVFDQLLRWGVQQSSLSANRVASGFAGLLAMALILYPAFTGFPFTKYKQGEAPELYQYLAQQPKDIVVGSIAKEANNIPTFAQRSVLVSEMYAIPYQVGYYRQIRQRTLDLVQAQYSPNLADVQRVIRQYGIDFWLLDHNAFVPEYLAQNNWLMQFQPTRDAIAQLQQGNTPALSKLVDRCSALRNDEVMLLEADCLLQE
jgi:hypothetical protein